MTTHRTTRLTRIGALALLGLTLPAIGWTDPLSIRKWTVDGGGVTEISAGPYVVGGTIGQPDAARLVAGSYQLTGGFWGIGAGSTTAVGGGGDDGEGPGSGPGSSGLPTALRVYPAAPNPAIDHTTIRFDLPAPAEIEVRIHDIAGALVRVYAGSVMPGGRHALHWNATDAGGRRVAAGVYLVRVRLGTMSRSQKLMIVH